MAALSSRWWLVPHSVQVQCRVANIRGHHIHALTTRLAKTHGEIVVEGLDAAGMLRQKGLAGARARRRGLSDSALGATRRQLAYKTAWYGSTLVVADRWYPSTSPYQAGALAFANAHGIALVTVREGRFLFEPRDALPKPSMSREEAAKIFGLPLFVSSYYGPGGEPGTTRVWLLSPDDDEYPRYVAELLLGRPSR